MKHYIAKTSCSTWVLSESVSEWVRSSLFFFNYCYARPPPLAKGYYLNDALTLRSTAHGMNSIAREIGWRRIVSKWQYKLSHLPAEQNEEADALSRLSAVPRKLFPEEALGSATFVKPPAQDGKLWRT